VKSAGIFNGLTKTTEIPELRLDDCAQYAEQEGVTSDEKTNQAGWGAERGGSTYRRSCGGQGVGRGFGGASGGRKTK